ncbi:DUF7344 domain-containing protein [Halorubellus salinus]|uniref:DUF7344 domain-containing protein n=1 Tax=Halorubellus salinus TaxID=755309 RepID=UPI001D05D97A|nr:hypothetical protein [Halorubellus salinus]
MIDTTTEHTTDQSSGPVFDESTRHQVLAEERRRTACDVLAEREHDVQLGDLADAVAGREASDHAPASTEAVRVTLHHVHLPLLDDVGAVDYDPSTTRVTPSAAPLDELAH